MFDLCGLVLAGCKVLMVLLDLNGFQTQLMVAAMHGKISIGQIFLGSYGELPFKLYTG